MPSSLDLSRTYTSFSGVDIRAVVAGKPIGQLRQFLMLSSARKHLSTLWVE